MTKMHLKDPDARKLFLSGKAILEELESSDLFARVSTNNNSSSVSTNNSNEKSNIWLSQYPVFDASEIVVGPVLGHGGFGIVNEVQDIVLSNINDGLNTRTNKNHVDTPIVVHEDDITTTDSDSDDNNKLNKRRQKNKEATDFFDCSMARSFVAANVRRRCTNDPGSKNQNQLATSLSTAPNGKSSQSTATTAARYAIKRLKSDLNELSRVRGSIDLTIEVMLLSRLHHPNIVKMRGFANTPLLDPHFFIVMDRLYEILNHRILDWKTELRKNSKSIWQAILPHRRRLNQSTNSNCDTVDQKQERESVVHDVMVQRLIVAYDLASAFAYMHENNVVYRDIKQENVGFDVRGDVKVFDFGLSKGVSSSMKAHDMNNGSIEYGYNLTPRTGSIPYMAPEVMAGRPYDGQCDVYSFAILLWEIFTLRQAFPNMNRHDYAERVAFNGERLSFPLRSGIVPTSIKELIKDAWDGKPTQRPLMSNVAKRIRIELNHMSDGDDKILRRSIHMYNRSNHSFRIEVQKQRSNQSLIRRSSSSNLLPPTSSSKLLRRSTSESSHHGSTSLSQSKSSFKGKFDLHYYGPSLHNDVEA